MEICCKNCGASKVKLNGIVRNKQRYQCKSCLYNFVVGDNRIKTENDVKRAMAVILYSKGKCSYNFIAQFLGVGCSSVYSWIKKATNEVSFPEILDNISAIEFDEMWHFIQSKKTNVGSSKLLIGELKEPLLGLLETVMQQHSKGYITKSNI